MGSLKHLHKYMRVKSRGSKKYIGRCMKDGCTHWVPEVMLQGRIAECFYCGNPFTISYEGARLKRIHCDNCTKKKNPSEVVKTEEITSFLSEIKEVEK